MDFGKGAILDQVSRFRRSQLLDLPLDLELNLFLSGDSRWFVLGLQVLMQILDAVPILEVRVFRSSHSLRRKIR